MSDGALAGSRRTAARGGHDAARTGRRARRSRHRQDTRDHAPHRARRRHRRVLARSRHGGDLHGEGGGRDARATARAGRRGRRRAHVPRGRARAAQLLLADGRRRHAPPASSTTRCACSRTPPTAWASSPTSRPSATSRARSSGARSRCAASSSTPRRGPNGVGRLDVARVADLQRAYEKLKDERRQLDFEDVLLACAGMLEAEPHVAASVHEQYRHFTVDEFQDVSPLQHRLLELWRGDRRDICVVGDASQTIYSFAGADARFLLDFAGRPRGRARRAAARRTTDRMPRSSPSRTSSCATGRARSHLTAAARETRPDAPTHRRSSRRRSRRTTTTSPRRAVSRRRSPQQIAAGHRSAPHRDPVPRALAVRRARRGAGRSRDRGDGARRAAVLRPARGASGGHGAARRLGRARSRAASSTPCATCCARSA